MTSSGSYFLATKLSPADRQQKLQGFAFQTEIHCFNEKLHCFLICPLALISIMLLITHPWSHYYSDWGFQAAALNDQQTG